MFNPYRIVTKPGWSPGEAPEVWAALDWLSEDFTILLHVVRPQQGSVASVLSAEMCWDGHFVKDFSFATRRKWEAIR